MSIVLSYAASSYTVSQKRLFLFSVDYIKNESVLNEPISIIYLDTLQSEENWHKWIKIHPSQLKNCLCTTLWNAN